MIILALAVDWKDAIPTDCLRSVLQRLICWWQMYDISNYMSTACIFHMTIPAGVSNREGGAIGGRDTELTQFLEQAGIDSRTGTAALEVDGVLQHWRRRVNKRELGAAALAAFGLDDEIDLAQLDVMMAIWAPASAFGGDDETEEVMVATIATRLRIDPSRASRVVSDLIARGLARRTASQRDARRTLVELTDRGTAIIEAVRRFKFLILGEFLSGWSEEELALFVPLFERFAAWTEEAGPIGRTRFPEEIKAIAEQLAKDPGTT